MHDGSLFLSPRLVFRVYCTFPGSTDSPLHPFSVSTTRFQPLLTVFSLHLPFSSLPPIIYPYHPLFIPTIHYSSQPPIFHPYPFFSSHRDYFSFTDPFFSPFHIIHLAAFFVHVASCRSHITSLIVELFMSKIILILYCLLNLEIRYKFKSGVPPKLRPAGAEYEFNDD
jgi:hypothetical protein